MAVDALFGVGRKALEAVHAATSGHGSFQLDAGLDVTAPRADPAAALSRRVAPGHARAGVRPLGRRPVHPVHGAGPAGAEVVIDLARYAAAAAARTSLPAAPAVEQHPTPREETQ